MWQQWIEIYRALYLAAGSPDTLVNTNCVTIANLDVLSEVFCSLTMQGTATLLASFYIPDIVDTFERAIAAGYTGDGDTDPFQREAAVDVLRDDHYQDGIDGQLVILEDVPTECVLVAPGVPTVTPGELLFDAVFSAIPVTASLLRYEYSLDATDSWTSNGTSTTITGGVAPAGDHVLNVRAVSISGVEGEIAVSALFTVEGSQNAPIRTNLVMELTGDNAPSGSVALWEDTSGEGNDMAQASSGEQPVKVDNEINGHAIVRFDATDDGMLSSLNLVMPYTIFLVERPASNGSTRTVTASSGNRLIANGRPPLVAYIGNAVSDVDVSAGTVSITALVVDTTGDAIYYRNNADITSSPAAVADWGTVSLGAENPFNEPADTDIAEILVYDAILSGPDRAEIFDYLEDKYTP